MSKSALAVGTRGWRGQEGSMTDGDSGLVPMYIGMQSRHYDPTIGRFIQADSLSLGSLTTQGMNRYVYTENDPVNKSDPSGQYGEPPSPSGGMSAFFIGLGIAILAVVAVLGFFALTSVFPGSALILAAVLLSTAFLGLASIFQGLAYYPGFSDSRRCILNKIATNLNLLKGGFALFEGIITGIADIIVTWLEILSWVPTFRRPTIPADHSPVWDRWRPDDVLTMTRFCTLLA